MFLFANVGWIKLLAKDAACSIKLLVDVASLLLVDVCGVKLLADVAVASCCQGRRYKYTPCHMRAVAWQQANLQSVVLRATALRLMVQGKRLRMVLSIRNTHSGSMLQN